VNYGCSRIEFKDIDEVNEQNRLVEGFDPMDGSAS